MQRKLIAALAISLVAFALAPCSKNKKEEKKVKKNPLSALPVFVAGSPNQSDHLPFDWAIYEDPSRPEFWDDGADGTLPRPFLYLAGHPTRENAQKLIAWQSLQWQTIEKIIASLEGGKRELQLFSEYLGEPLGEHLKQKEIELKNVSYTGEKSDSEGIDWQQIRMVYIYRSSCPACKKASSLLKRLEDLRVEISYLQTDFADNPPLHKDSVPYDTELADYFPYEVTPTFYLKVGHYAPQRSDGYIDFDSIKNHIKNIKGG